MSRNDDNDYEVGYGKPPKATQFRKGQSGNPRGRPKGARGVRASLRRELESMITVKEGGEELRISKGAAAAKQLVAKALKGDLKALQVVLGQDEDWSASEVSSADTEEAARTAEPVDYDILRDFFSELAHSSDSSEDPEDEDDRA